MIYVPNLESCKCVSWQNSDTLRCYKQQPRPNSNVDYIDYFVNSHYLTDENIQQFGSYYYSVNCINTNKLTDNSLYRNDITSIILLYLMISFIILFPTIKLFKRLFRGR